MGWSNVENRLEGEIESETSTSNEKFRPKEKLASSNVVIDYQLRTYLHGAIELMALNIVTGVPYCIPSMLYLGFIGKEVLGICNVRLELLRTTILLSRAAFLKERHCHRFPRVEWSSKVNLIWLMVPTVAISSYVICFFWLGNWNWLQLPSEEYIQDYQFAVIAIGVSCVIEALAEPAAYTLPTPLLPKSTMEVFHQIKHCFNNSAVFS